MKLAGRWSSIRGVKFLTLRTSSLAASLALGSLSLVGCSDSEWETAYRLERAAALAAVSPETTFLDFGTDEARVRLIDGWSFNETNDAGLSFVWSHGPTSSFGFYAFPPAGDAAPATLRFRALPLEAPDAPEQRIDLEINGRELGELVLPEGIAESEFSIPVDALIAGWNVLDVRYSWIRSDLASQQDRRWRRIDRDLAVAWIEARLEHPAIRSEPSSTQSPGIDLRGEVLEIPAHQLLEFEFELSEGHRLVVEQGSCDACGTGWQIEVYLGRLEEAGLRLAGTLNPTTPAVDLGTDRLDTYRLLLRNRSEQVVALQHPRIERPSAAQR